MVFWRASVACAKMIAETANSIDSADCTYWA